MQYRGLLQIYYKLLIDWLFIDRVDKEKQTIVIEIETISSQLETALKAKVSCFDKISTRLFLRCFLAFV